MCYLKKKLLKREKLSKREKSFGKWSETNDLERLYTIEKEFLFIEICLNEHRMSVLRLR